MKLNGLLTLKQLSISKIMDILNYSLEFKNGLCVSYSGKRFATIFFENSTRTHYSFIMAMKKLGIDVIDCNVQVSSVQKGETLYDTIKTFEAIGVDGVVVRHSKDEYFNELDGINIPVFNGGDGKSNHPTQSLLDLMTIYEEFGKFDGLKCCIIGDIAHSRVAHTNIEVMRRLNMDVYISGPEEFNDGSAPYLTIDEGLKGEFDIHVTVACPGTIAKTIKVRLTVGFYAPKVGDFAYANGSFSQVCDPSQGLVGVVFYCNKTEDAENH